jgi:hypothetical protein
VRVASSIWRFVCWWSCLFTHAVSAYLMDSRTEDGIEGGGEGEGRGDGEGYREYEEIASRGLSRS